MTALADERPVVFDCDGDRLVGIVHHASSASHRGVLIVVGGPQYRVGSHRLFVALARGLAAAGVPTMRFDYRGMGDSDGDYRGFEHIEADIAAAVRAFAEAAPGLREIVLWGLCDAASAIVMSAARLPQVPAIVLVNPWVRSEATEARAILRHYYLMRLLERAFWRKLLRGGVNPLTVVRGVRHTVRRAYGATSLATAAPAQPAYPPGTLMPQPPADGKPLPERMADGLARFDGRMLLITSGRDLTAREFQDVVSASRRWQRLLTRARVDRRAFAGCDHTFSHPECLSAVIAATVDWVTGALSRPSADRRAAEDSAPAPSR